MRSTSMSLVGGYGTGRQTLMSSPLGIQTSLERTWCMNLMETMPCL